MDLRTEGGQLKLGGAFKLVAAGYFLGVLVIFLPLFALVTVVSLASGVPMVNGQEVEGGGGAVVAILPMIMLPVVVAVQAAMFGGLVVLGLWLYSKRRPIRVIEA